MNGTILLRKEGVIRAMAARTLIAHKARKMNANGVMIKCKCNTVR